jgi:tyrosyl-tRNA synthetase
MFSPVTPACCADRYEPSIRQDRGVNSVVSSQQIIPELQWRGLIAQSTDLEELSKVCANPVTLYCGFDPTAPSLHLGNLVQVLTVRRFQQHGHKPLALVGGATGLIGDPKESGERTLNSVDLVGEWVERIRVQLERFYEFDGSNSARMVNNLEWTQDLNAIEFLRDIGKHFSVNRMLDREAVSARLAKDGISFTEFSYQLLQSFDYLELYRRYNCVLQTGGSDQWGNITAGVDLVRRVEAKGVHALTTPLLTRADGKKFGKTESGTIWLDPELTSPYSFFQYWINADDRDIPNLLKTFSFKSEPEINELLQASIERPQERAGQRALASELTELVHGAAERAGAEDAGKALFGGGDLADLPESTLSAALTEASLGEVDTSEVVDGKLPTLDELLVRCGLAPSKKAARRTIAEGGAYVNNIRVDQEDFQVPVSELLHGQWVVLRRGRKAFAGVVVK